MKSSKPSVLARALKNFFLDYLPNQRALSPLTAQSYRDSLKLLLVFVADKKGDRDRASPASSFFSRN